MALLAVVLMFFGLLAASQVESVTVESGALVQLAPLATTEQLQDLVALVEVAQRQLVAFRVWLETLLSQAVQLQDQYQALVMASVMFLQAQVWFS